MHKPTTLFIGPDVPKDSISVAHAADDPSTDVTYAGPISTSPAAHPRPPTDPPR